MNQMLHRASIRNRQSLKPIHIFTSMAGVNMASEVEARNPSKTKTLILSCLSLMGLAAQYNFIWANREKSLVFYTDALCTSFQTVITLTKIAHMLLMHSHVFNMLQTVQNSVVLRDLEIFELDLPNKAKMIMDVEEIILKSWNNIKIQRRIFVIPVSTTCFWYFISAFLMDFYKTFIKPQEFEIEFSFPARFPMWVDKGMESPYFYIAYFIVGTETYLCGVTAAIFASIYMVFSLHGVALIEILRNFLSYTTIDELVPAKERLNYLRCCIKLQQRIDDYIDRLNSIYKLEFLPVFIITMFVNCLIIFQASISDEFYLVVRAFLYISATTLEIAFCCYNCQWLTTESSELPFAYYTNSWYNESREFKRLTNMMILRSNRDVQITLGGFTILSLETLMTMMQSTVSYFLLLREVNDVN